SKCPKPRRGAVCQAERSRSLLTTQAGEEAQLDQLGSQRILHGQFLQGVVDGENSVVDGVSSKVQFGQVDFCGAGAALLTAFTARVFNQNAAHGLCCGAEKMSAA